ncbi:MAG: carbohydrate-binding protein [Chthoniobacterales bacterium]|nr:carbohydrate-binding protein [Chthoniobacterales bacterium]
MLPLFAAVFNAQTILAAGTSVSPLQQLVDDAGPGATVRVPVGVYEGNLVIEKPLHLIGDEGAEIRGTGRGKTVAITAPDVTLEGFRIRGSGRDLMDDDATVFVAADRATIINNSIDDCLHGIYLKKVKDCRITGNVITGTAIVADTSDPGDDPENCDASTPVGGPGNGIHQWNCERTEIAGNTITRTRDGIYFSFTNHCRIEGNKVSRVRYGLHYMYSDDNTFEGNRFFANAGGAAVMFSERVTIHDNDFVDNRGSRATGLILLSVDDSVIEGNRIGKNALGLSLNQCNRNRFIANAVDGNHVGMRFGGNSDDNAFSANSFRRNLYPAEMTGESGTNRWEVAGVGNRWDNVAPVDFNADGIGDLPHRELDVLGSLRRDFAPVSLLAGSPALWLVRFAHQRAALPGLNTIQDNSPLLDVAPAGRFFRPKP